MARFCFHWALRKQTLRPVPRRCAGFCVDPGTVTAAWSGEEPAISGVVQAVAHGLVFALVRLLHPHANSLEEATPDVCSLVLTGVFSWRKRECIELRANTAKWPQICYLLNARN